MATSRIFLAALFAALCPLSSSAQNASSTLPDGIALPAKGTVFALDRKDGASMLVQLHPTEVVSNPHAAGNFARSMVYAGAHGSVELKGLNAAIGLTDDHVCFFVRINADDPELMRAQVHLIHLEQSKSTRIVSVFTQNVFGGDRQKKFQDIDVVKSDAEPDVWLKLTPDKPLAPGEYGIAFIPKDATLTAGVVYDFDVAVDVAKPEKK